MITVIDIVIITLRIIIGIVVKYPLYTILLNLETNHHQNHHPFRNQNAPSQNSGLKSKAVHSGKKRLHNCQNQDLQPKSLYQAIMKKNITALVANGGKSLIIETLIVETVETQDILTVKIVETVETDILGAACRKTLQ